MRVSEIRVNQIRVNQGLGVHGSLLIKHRCCGMQLTERIVFFWPRFYEVEHYVHCKCLQGIAGTLQGNRSAGISNLGGLHVYPQSL